MLLRFVLLTLFLFGIIIAGSPGPEYSEIIPNSGVFLPKDTPLGATVLIQKVLSTGYIPTDDEINQLRFCRFIINKDNHFIELEAAIIPQVLQDGKNATTQYTLAGGLKQLNAAIGWREVSQAEIDSMKRYSEAQKKPNQK